MKGNSIEEKVSTGNVPREDCAPTDQSRGQAAGTEGCAFRTPGLDERRPWTQRLQAGLTHLSERIIACSSWAIYTRRLFRRGCLRSSSAGVHGGLAQEEASGADPERSEPASEAGSVPALQGQSCAKKREDSPQSSGTDPSAANPRAKPGLSRSLRSRFLRRAALPLLCLALLGLVAAVDWLTRPVDPSIYLRAHASGRILDASGRQCYAFLNKDMAWCFPVDLKAISPSLVQATLAVEDQRFYTHPGVDPIALVRAAWQNLRHRKVISGASTITMQVVKQAGAPRRSYLEKCRQTARALRLERSASKDAILEAYLNGAPYGMNLVGCEAAARRYFAKSARELTLPEAALLAGLPKAPSDLLPLKYPAAALARRNYVLLRMREEGFIAEDQYVRAVEAPLDADWRPLPGLAPHVAMRFAARARDGAAIATTLNATVQARAEELAVEHLKPLTGEVGNAAIVVADVASASIVAWVGSADFFRAPGGGQVDACRAARSPGSALKPFTYALAIEETCLYSSETLLDGTLDYGLYQPVNFDGRYRGVVSAGYALKRSLNVPAVAVLDRVGYGNVYSFLKMLGLSTLNRPADAYGLGLTLGNCEVRLDELAAAYCCIANLGEYRPLRMLPDAPAAPKRCLARGTCLALYDMLEQPLPDDFDSTYFPSAEVQTRVCWKTGTSTGLHDAWAVVFNAQYVVAVWMGNNSGKSSPRLVGANAALPLAADVFRSLPKTGAADWPEAKDDLRDVKVCAVSGLPVSPWCTVAKHVLLPRVQYLNRTCDMHYPAADGAVVTRWPGAAKGWDLAKVASPRIAQADAKAARAEALRIITPSDKSEYVLTGESNGDRIQVHASIDAEALLHWYLDERYLGVSSPKESLYLNLTPGKHVLACMTTGGSVETANFTVALPQTSNFFAR